MSKHSKHQAPRDRQDETNAPVDPVEGSTQPESEVPTDPELMGRLLETALKERDEYRDQFMRALADLQNFRRRVAKESEETRKYATAEMVRQLLPVLDNFERSLAFLASGASTEAVLEGLRAVDRQLRSVLESVKVEKIEPVGQPFDPEHHEAVALEASTEHPEGTVLEVLEPGYRMGERVIRPARVKVTKQS